jgi:hypothetical protein
MGRTMARRKKHPKPVGRHLDPKETFHLPVQLQLALECAAALADVPASKSAFLRSRLEKVLRDEGWLPLEEESLRRLVEAVGFENLQPQSQDYLRKLGIEQE